MAESNRGGAKIMKTLYYPTIGANGSAGYTKLDSENELFKTEGNPNWTLGVGVQWTLFDGFANSAKSAQYLSDARKLETIASAMEKVVQIAIRTSISECSAADSNEAAMREMLAAATEGYQLTKDEFERGNGRVIELQEAEELLQQAELGLVSAQYRIIRSRAALLVEMGRFIVTMEGTGK
jgi:outer membrane protein TolC